MAGPQTIYSSSAPRERWNPSTASVFMWRVGEEWWYGGIWSKPDIGARALKRAVAQGAQYIVRIKFKEAAYATLPRN